MEEAAKVFFQANKLGKVRRASKLGALGGDPVSIVFSDLRHKFLNNIGSDKKYKDLEKMPDWLLESPEYQEIAYEHSKKRSVFEVCKREKRTDSENQVVKEYLLQNVAYF